ncbi:protein rolling stone-like [Eurosta solidaginis]|uniref:protein rolling stone-like n=1 Tax=Eurosta solidaginis TaxID=178769 RepID=UPI003531387D
MQVKTEIFHQLCHPLAKEFQIDKILLSHEPTSDFYKSQWQSQNKSIIWLIYRWIFAFIFIAGAVGSWLDRFCDGKWFIYLTNWGFSLCMLTSVSGALLVTIFYCGKENTVRPWVLKLYWMSHLTTVVFATVITLVYWTSIYPTQDNADKGSIVINLWSHAFNSIFMILDLMLIAFPGRILHFIYPLCLALIYTIFTVIYYYAGGVDCIGNRYIYPILDWSSPGWATLTVLGCYLLIFIFSWIHFGLYKLRTSIYHKQRNTVLTLHV